MVSNKKIKEIGKKEKKIIGTRVIKKIQKILEKEAEMMIKKASRNADFDGRKRLVEGDFE